MSEPADPPDNLPPGVTVGWDGRLRGPRGALYDPKEAQAQYVATRAAKRRLKRAMELNGRTPEQLREEAAQARLDKIVPVVDPRFAAPIPIGTGHQGIHPLLPALRIPIRLTEVGNMAVKNTPLDDLYNNLARYINDPLGFVLWAFPWGEPGTPLEEMEGPEQWQRDQLTRIGQRLTEGGAEGAVIEEDTSAGHGVGKAHDVNMVFDTPGGTRRWGDLQPGDRVFGADGAPTRVTQTHQFYDVPMYRVTFDDRSYCDVSSGHLWNVRGRQERRKKLDGWRTLETQQILELGVKRPNGAALARQWEIPIQQPAQFDEREVDLHPYFVGLWLGDGTKGQPSYGKPYPELADKLRALGYEVHCTAGGVNHRLQNITHLLTDPVFDCYGHERYIPDDYKFNTVENRMALFQGMCDSDGEVHHTGSIGYSTASRQLAEDFIWLARSLGCKAMLQETVKKPWYPDPVSGERVAGRDCYRVTVNAPFNPFTLKHRREAYKPSEPRYITRWIDSIEPLPNVPHGQCISVEAADGLYQANDFIVTHNSAEVSWLILWAISTHADTRGVVTANTDTQLRTKTWAELGKWYQLFIARQLFTLTATAIYIAGDKEREKTWRIDQIPWSKERSEAFAGLHNQGKRLLVIFDEASAIDDVIWEVTEGALTDAKTQIIWCRYGNPTKTSGAFFARCTQPRRNTYTRVDSREVSFSNKKQIQAWVDEYGDDSDFVRVRVKGQFPRAGYANFISPELVTQARRRRLEAVMYQVHPKVLAVDPARFGDDFSVITLRQGLKVHWQVALSGFDGPDLASRIFEIVRKGGQMLKGDGVPPGNISCVVYDAIGNGADLDSALRRMQGLPACIPVQWGQPAKDDKQYFNQRSECWGKMRDFLEHGQIPDDDDLANQLTSLDYGYDARFRIQLQSKKDLKKGGGKSPDKADSLSLSFVPELIDRKVTLAKVRPVQRRAVVWTR